MPYTFIKLREARMALAERLYEGRKSMPEPMQFQNHRELDTYIREALQTFNAVANFYREEFIFMTEPGEPWYDITTKFGSLRPLTTTDFQILNQIEYHLLEPLSEEYPLEWDGSLQFNLENILGSIQTGRDKTLSETGCTVNQSIIPAPPQRIFLDDSVMDIRRLCWLPNKSQKTYTPNVVLPSDLWATQSFQAGFPQREFGTPLIYRRTSEPPVSFDVDITPAVNGQYDLLTTNNAGRLVIEHPAILPIPNDWCWVAKYAALSQLFGRESLAKDQLREDYCDKRWKQGTSMMQTAPAILAARINNVPVIVDSMSNGDFYFANWQGKKHGRPRYIFYSGLNMIALAPIPDAVYSVTVPVVRNMPLPYDDDDFLQIGRDDYFPVLDLAQHIGMLKVGGAEFSITFPLLANFLRHCGLYNSKLNAMSLWREWMDNRPQEEMLKVNPIFSPSADPTTAEKQGG
jgi:hypothetical protein